MSLDVSLEPAIFILFKRQVTYFQFVYLWLLTPTITQMFQTLILPSRLRAQSLASKLFTPNQTMKWIWSDKQKSLKMSLSHFFIACWNFNSYCCSWQNATSFQSWSKIFLILPANLLPFCCSVVRRVKWTKKILPFFIRIGDLLEEMFVQLCFVSVPKIYPTGNLEYRQRIYFFRNQPKFSFYVIHYLLLWTDFLLINGAS